MLTKEQRETCIKDLIEDLDGIIYYPSSVMSEEYRDMLCRTALRLKKAEWMFLGASTAEIKEMLNEVQEYYRKETVGA